MGYKNAGNILPQGLLAAVQAYIDGEYLYIPRKECNKQAWGTLSKSKQYFSVRNAAIRAEHQAGMSVKKLSAQYCLSIKTIYKIIVSGRADHGKRHALTAWRYFISEPEWGISFSEQRL